MDVANFKRKRAKKQRAGCFLCRPWKMNGQRNGFGQQPKQEQKARISEKEQRLDC
jgi:hypothetical protein